jgi:hypothetical protein
MVENYFSKIKEFRGVDTRYDKTDSSYEATWNLAAAIIALRWMSTDTRSLDENWKVILNVLGYG